MFFALWPPEDVAQALGDTAEALARRFGGRPTRRQTIHLTLAFLGDVALVELPKLLAAGDQIDASAFSLNIDRVAYWSHNHLLWAGPGQAPASLLELRRQLVCALAEAGHPVATPDRPFAPHLSLVRRVTTPPAGTDFPEAFRPAPLDWPCGSFVLVRSMATPAGSAYSIARSFALA